MNLFTCFSDFRIDLSFSCFAVDVGLFLGNDSRSERRSGFPGVVVFSCAEFLVYRYAKATVSDR